MSWKEGRYLQLKKLDFSIILIYETWHQSYVLILPFHIQGEEDKGVK